MKAPKRRLFIGLQHILPQHALTRLVHIATRSRASWLSRVLIRAFMRHFRPDMSEAVEPDPFAYPTFNEFFTRALRADARPIDRDPDVLVSPVDGRVSQLGRIEDRQIFQAKGRRYSLDALLGGPGEWAARFAGGWFATLYLAPFNYHRVHMPLGGALRAAWYVPGRLFSVNAATVAAVDNLFARNERVVCVFEEGPQVFALVLVGAFFVGSISTVWHGEVTPRRPRVPCALKLGETAAPLRLAAGAEMGRFNMGSTVILLLPPGPLEWRTGVEPGAEVRVGRALARLARPT